MTGIFRKWWFWGLAVLLIAAAGVTCYLWPKKYKLTVSPETTVLLGPLNPDGTVNYVAALNQMHGQGVTPENNAAVLVIQAAGPDMLRRVTRHRVLKRLGMQALPESGPYFVYLSDYVQKAENSPAAPPRSEEETGKWARELVEKTRVAPWSVRDYPMVARWLEANAKPLALVVSATRRSRFYIPLISWRSPPVLMETEDPSLSIFRAMATALGARAMLRVTEGRMEEAASDMLACHRLARLLSHYPRLAGQVGAFALENTACENSAGFATTVQLSAAQAKAFLAKLQALPPLRGVVESIDRAERFQSLDVVGMLARRSWKRGLFGGRKPREEEFLSDIVINVDWDEVLRKFNYWFDMQVLAMRERTFSERQSAGEKFYAAFMDYSVNVGPRKRSRFGTANAGDALVSNLTFAMSNPRRLQDRGAMYLEVVKLAAALAADKAEKGTYPESLGELVPEYFKKLPEDLFAEGPLTYRRVGKGYLLYSIGENMQDDDGKSGESGGDDIAVRAE